MTDKEVIQKMVATQAEQHVKIEAIEKTCQEIRDSLLGNGKPGLTTRMALLEQKEQTRSRFIWVIVAAVATLGAETAFALFR